MKHSMKRRMTLGDLVQIVARYAHSDHEVGLVVAALIHRGVVRVNSPKRKA